MILLLDTALETSTIALAENGRVLFLEENPVTSDSASWLHPAINRLLSQAGMNIRELDAVAVVAGPGSYTGLRVGMAAAKGFCYALKIPLITQNTLRVMAMAMLANSMERDVLICPMIDARRNEVYTALYQVDGLELSSPRALILDKNSFEEELSLNRIVFFGNGAKKWEKINESKSAIFKSQPISIQAFAELAANDFQVKNWADAIFTEPVYLKEFFSY
jgi:tRNA threonylcarbamoyladenosine biosynthesis protein TsaB